MAKISRNGVNQHDLVNLLRAMRNRVFSLVTLAMGGTTTRIKTTSTAQFCINGVNYSKAAEDNIDVNVAGIVDTGVGEFCKIRIEVDTAGTVSFVQGGVASAQIHAKVPPRSAGKATLGYVEIPASFVFGTTLFNVAGVAFVNGDPDLGTEVLEA